MENVMGIEWQEGAVCFADGEQWFVNSSGDDKRYQLQNFSGGKFYSFYGIINLAKHFQLNTIKLGDYIEASELDTEHKYNDVVEVFELSGLECHASYSLLKSYGNLYVESGTEVYACTDESESVERKITYNQLMAIGELKRLEIERNKSAPKTTPDLTPDLVNKPSHYQFFEGVEVIEIIAGSMTREQFKGYCLGNRIKYRLRAGKKDELEQEIAKSDKYVELYDEHKHLCKK